MTLWFIWASLWENMSSEVSNQVRLKLACSATEASMRIEILVTETRDITRSWQRTTKALIRLRGCAGWSAPLLFAYDIRHVFSWPGSFYLGQRCKIDWFGSERVKLFLDSSQTVLNWFTVGLFCHYIQICLKTINHDLFTYVSKITYIFSSLMDLASQLWSDLNFWKKNKYEKSNKKIIPYST